MTDPAAAVDPTAILARAEQELAKIAHVGEWFAANLPPNGWTIFWQQDAPVCHMRWTDGLRPEVEQRLQDEAAFIAASPQLVRDLVACVRALQVQRDDKRGVGCPKCADAPTHDCGEHDWRMEYGLSVMRAEAADAKVAALQVQRDRNIAMALEVGQILGPEWDGRDFRELARALKAADAKVAALQAERDAAFREREALMSAINPSRSLCEVRYVATLADAHRQDSETIDSFDDLLTTEGNIRARLNERDAALARVAALEQERLHAVLTALESVQAQGYFLHDAQGRVVDDKAEYVAIITRALDAALTRGPQRET